NGGRRAYVVRIVHDYGEGDARNGEGTAAGDVVGLTPRGGGTLRLRARNEGSWGNGLRAALTFRARPLAYLSAGPGELVLLPDAPVAAGTLLRLWLPGGVPLLRFLTDVDDRWRSDAPSRERFAVLESPLPFAPARAEVVEATLYLSDGSTDGIGRAEVHERLGLSPRHRRFVGAILHAESALAFPDAAWIGSDLLPDDPFLRDPADAPAPQFTCGRDRYPDLVPGDFFDPRWTPGDEQPRGGIHALAEVDEVAVLVVPDLYSPAPLPARAEADATISLAGPRFERCVEPAAPPAPLPPSTCPDPRPGDGHDEELTGLRLDPLDPGERAQIGLLQQAVIDLTELLERWVVLLDAPPGLGQRQLLEWRAGFSSMWAAGYHPWPLVSRPDDARDPLVPVNPAAFAAGIVARQEVAFGVQHGPSNVLAVGAVDVTDRVVRPRHDELHQAALNVFVPERDGIRLTAGRTLSGDPQWRQLSVRRLVSMLRRALLEQMQWTVFEPNDAALRDELTRLLEGYLGELFRAGAFRGRTPAEGFFVRCDEALNPRQVVDEGKLICHVGIAPVEPIEFIVLRLTREGDGTLTAEA
ncbi:MAG TPA: phage tail sheath C-terminal domain-containing protein, partial [Longimicrobium sp.]|nr:phage tail sheath C-terminal domain-containing protein [Longimicrobium sp.]